MTEKNMKETWSMDDLVALTDEVQTDEIDYRGKLVKFQFCELTESEEPKFKNLGPDITEDEKMAVYQELGSERCLRMIYSQLMIIIIYQEVFHRLFKK